MEYLAVFIVGFAVGVLFVVCNMDNFELIKTDDEGNQVVVVSGRVYDLVERIRTDVMKPERHNQDEEN